MKKVIITLAIAITVHSSYAQWTNVSGTGNFYLNSGNVGIGTTDPGPSTKLVIAGSGFMQNITNTSDQDLIFSLTLPNAIDKYALISPSTTTNLALGV